MNTPHDQQTELMATHWQQPLWFALAGLCMGLLLKVVDWSLLDASVSWVGLRTTLPFSLMLFLPVALLLWKSTQRRLIPLYFISMLAIALWVGGQAQLTEDWEGHSVPSFNFMSVAFHFLLILVVMISLPFVQAWQQQRPHYAYERLFAYAWNNVHSVLLASAFALLVFLLALLATSLFDRVLSSGAQPLWASTQGSLVSYLEANYELVILAALGAGLSVIQQYDAVLLRLHTLVFALYRILAYLLAVIIIGFSLMMLPQWQNFLAEENAALIFLALVLASLLFLNTLIERGSVSLPNLAQGLFGAQLVLLPILTALAVYAIAVRTQQYGLSPSRMLSLLLSLLLLIYTLSYAVQFIRLRRYWSDGLKVVNPPLAVITALLALLTLTPVLDPQAWSVRNQLARLQNGTVSAQRFDYRSLLTKLGKPGVEAATQLRTWQERPDYAVIVRGLDNEQTQKMDPNLKTQNALAKLKIIPATQPIDPRAFADRAEQILNAEAYGSKPTCYREVLANTDCLLVFQDVNGDGKNEALLLAFSTPTTNHNTQSQYQIDGRLYLLDETGLPIASKVLSNATVKTEVNQTNLLQWPIYPNLDKTTFGQAKAAAEARQLTPVMPSLPELQIGGQYLKER